MNATMMERPLVRRALAGATAAAAALGLAAIGAPAAHADGHMVPCAKHKHEVARRHGSSLWVRGGSLFGCVSGYLDDFAGSEVDHEGADLSYPPSKSRRLGPWTPQSRVVFDGVNVTWALRTHAPSGDPVDRLYAVDARDGHRWLRGVQPTFDAADRVVADLKLGQNFVAWVTEGGTVMAAAEAGFGDPADPDPFDLQLVGAGTAGSPGLVSALSMQGRRLLIGQFGAQQEQVAATLRLRIADATDMENEECIGSHRWEVTVQPVGGEPRVGGVWRASYFPSDPYCE